MPPLTDHGDRAGVEQAPASSQVPEPRRSPLLGLVGAALLAAGAGAWLVSSSYTETAAVTVVGGNLPVNAGATDQADISAHNSPTLARSPVDGSRLAVANRIDSPRFSCAVHVSSDGGATWEQAAVPIPEGEEPKCYAADAAFGADGTLYVSYVTLKGLGNGPNAVWLTMWDEEASALSPPVKALGPLAFQVRLVADGAVSGRLYLSWLQASDTAHLAFPTTGNPVQMARSDDGGRTWGDPVRVSDAARERVVAPSPAVGANGEVYVLYLDLGNDRLDYAGGHEGRGGEPYHGRWKLVAARSGDKGATWSEAVVEDRLVPTERFVVFLPPAPSLAVDRGTGRVYAAFADGRLGDADVWVWRSDDAGTGWSRPVRVNDTRRGDGTSQYLPKLALSSAGRLDVVYYDRRADRMNVMNEVSLQSSFDGGRTFTERTRLSDRPFSSRVGFGSERDLPDLGSRLGLVSTEGRALAVWSDTRAGTEASRKQDLVRALVEITAPRDLPGPAGEILKAAGAAAAMAGAITIGAAVVAVLSMRRSRRAVSR